MVRDWMLALAALAALVTIAPQEGRKPKKGEAAPPPDYELSEELKDVPAQDLRALDDERQRYFLIGPKKGEKAPAGGFALMIVLPGGDGGADFTGFVRNLWKEVAPDDWVFAQMVAVKWKPDQQTIWPTRFSRVPGMEFTTEEFLDAVVEDVQTRRKLRIDPKRVYQLGWSSGGPAEYAIALREKTPVTGSYVAQSVFHLDELRPHVKHAKGRPFFIDHSPEDATCRFELAGLARDTLTKEGATVELVTYAGGHGWHDAPFVRLKKGFEWLDEQSRKPAKRK